MGLGLQYLDLHSLKINMLFKLINKKEILKEVKKNVSLAREEILATMLLKEELENPLPVSYFNLLRNKVNEGISLKRLGFGTKEEYNKVSSKILSDKKNYIFRFTTKELDYQRLIIIDRKKMFFSIDNLYFMSIHKPLIKVFADYFGRNFEKGKL